MLTPKAIAILEARALDPELLGNLGVETYSGKGGGEWIKIPFKRKGTVVNNKYRSISGEKQFHQDKGGVKCFWNEDCLRDPSLKKLPLIITEGEPDAWAFMQAGFPRVVSVPDGAPAEAIDDTDSVKFSYLQDPEFRKLIGPDNVSAIILATDGDGPGQVLMAELAKRLGKSRCKWISYPQGSKDANDVLKAHGEPAVRELIKGAQFFAVPGLYKMSQLAPLPEKRVYDVGMNIGAHWNIRRGDFTVVTGIPSMGKSTFLNSVAGHMALGHRWKTCFASFEQEPQRDHKRNLRTFFTERLVVHSTPEELDRADRWIDDHFVFMVPGEDDEVDLTWVLDTIAGAVIQHDVSLAIVDPWNEMDHRRPRDMSLTEYTGFAIKEFKRLAKRLDIHLIVAAHPAKQRKNEDGIYSVPTLYDISDSAHWYNKPDAGIVIHRPDLETTLIRVAKSRYHDQIGVPGDVDAFYNRETGRYRILPPEPPPTATEDLDA